MTTQNEAVNYLVAARAERNAGRSYRLFESALGSCEAWEQEVGGTEPLKLCALILSEIAYEESAPNRRAARWKKALTLLEESLKTNLDAEVASTYAALAVDSYQDQFSNVALADRLKALRSAKSYIDTALKQPRDNTARSNLLARKSSLLRHLSIEELSLENKLNRLDESVRCSELAVNTSKEEAALIESALSLWSWARYEKTDEKYVETLREVETRLTDNLLSGNEVARMALSRFYKLTYRHLDACESYLALTKRVRQVRRLLRDSHVYAEAASHLRFANYPEVLARKHVVEARRLVEMAIAAGYRNARLITALAHTAAIADGAAAGATALGEMHAHSGAISWERVAEIVTQANMSEPATYGLAVGIDQSAVWTSLGTFSQRYVKDDSLTKLLYETAVKLDSRNPVALTNLARFLIAQGDEASLREAERLLQQAAGCADRRFTWWRAVIALLNEKKNQLGLQNAPIRVREELRGPPAVFRNLKQVRDRFRAIEQLADVQRRGYELEILIYSLAKLTFDLAAPPYRLNLPEGGEPQVDGFFEHRKGKYRVECKWEKTPADGNDIEIFKGKLDVVGVDGLFIAMSGFTEAAVGRANRYRGEKAILLMNGDEARYLLTLQLNFDELMTQKRLHFDQRSNPFHIVKPVYEAA